MQTIHSYKKESSGEQEQSQNLEDLLQHTGDGVVSQGQPPYRRGVGTGDNDPTTSGQRFLVDMGGAVR